MTTEEKEERAEQLANLVMKITIELGEAELTNGEEIDLLAMLLGLHLHKAASTCGPDAICKVLERFASRLTAMHPNLQAFVVERDEH